MNLDAYADLLPADTRDRAGVVLLAVTAPGADVLPWDEDHCAALGQHEHSGMLGCRVRLGEACKWNRSAPARWRSLHRAAYVRCRRQGHRPRLLTRVWEMQHRGALHVHPVLGFSTAAEKNAVRAYLAALVDLAPAHGFGYLERKLKPMRARAAAAYLSAYFVTGRKQKAQLQESVVHPLMPRSIIHVSTELTQTTGCTMRRLRLHRFIHVRWGVSPLCLGDTWHVLDRYATSDGGVARAQEEPCAAP